MTRATVVLLETQASDDDDADEKINNNEQSDQNGLYETNICPVMMKLPVKLRDRLLPFQKEGVRFAEKKNGRCLIADEMGLGKTLQAISVAYIYKNEWPLLIIVPSSLKFCWIEELEKWLPDVLPHQINLVQSGSDVSGMAICPITIVTYGLLRLPSSNIIREALNTRKFQVVICDESHYLKNINTLSCKTVIPILKMANRRLLLSGTPALAKPVELYPQIDAICPGKFGSFWQYTDRYCEAHTVYFGKFRKRKVDGASHLEELQHKLKSMLMIRREKSDVLTELPPKQRQKIMFELKNSPQKKEIIETFAELKRKMQRRNGTVQKVINMEDQNLEMGFNLSDVNSSSSDKNSTGVFSLISSLYRQSGEAKIGPVREYIEMLCEDEQLKFLVFAYHHNMMDGIQQTLWEKKVKFVRIDGGTRSSDRQIFVNQFQSDPETRVAILSILAAGMGLTFTAAKLVVFSELYWTPGVMVQCEDRAHRIGQTICLPVHYLVARDTMDEWVWSAVCKKTLVTSTALTGKTRHLDHEEGSSHQIELLSNADMWKQEEGNGDVDISELVQSQRASDQSSILEFFQSQRSPHCIPSRKRKYHQVSSKESSSASENQESSSIDKSPCQGSGNEIPDFKNKKLNSKTPAMSDSEIIIVSDDENDFKLTRKTRKIEHRKTNYKKQTEDKTEKRKQTKNRTMKNKILENDEKYDSLDLTDFDGSLNFDLNDFEDLESSFVEVNFGENNLLNGMSFNTKKKTASMEKSSCLNKTLKEESNRNCLYIRDAGTTSAKNEANENCLCSGGVKEMKAESDSAVISHKQVVRCSSESCVSLQSTVDHLKGSHSVISETPQGHSCLSDAKEQQTVETKSDQWSCSTCTFFNHPELPQCELCDTPKKKPTSILHQNSAVQKLSRTKCDSYTKKYQAKDSSPLSKSPRKKHCTNPVDSPSQRSQFTCTQFTVLKARNVSQNVSTIHSCSQILCSSRSTDVNCIVTDNCISDSDVVSSQTGSDFVLECQSISDSDVVSSQTGSDFVLECQSISDSDVVSSQTGSDSVSECQSISDSDVVSSHNLKFVSQCQSIVSGFDIENSHTGLKLMSQSQSTSQSRSLFPSTVTKPAGENDCQLQKLSTADLLNQAHGSGFDIPGNTSRSVLSPVLDSSESELDKSTPEILCVESCNILPPKEHSPLLPSTSIDESFSGLNYQSSKNRLHCESINNPGTNHRSTSANSTDPNCQSNVQHNHANSNRLTHSFLKFSCSIHTGRIYVYDENEHFLQASFHPVDIEMGNTDELPTILHEPHNLRLLQKFVREWSSLTDTKRKLIAKRCQVFTSPLSAYEAIRTVHGSKQRHLNKIDTVTSALKSVASFQGSIQVISKRAAPAQLDKECVDQSGTSLRGVAQVLTEDGVPLCLQCQKPFSNPLLSHQTISNPENAWQLRLCSFTCMDQYWTLRRAGYCRDQVYDLQQGVCQLCRFDAHSLFNQIRVTKNLKARADLIKHSPYRSLSGTQKEKMVEHPQAGQFWHVDHITPVWQGGGLCDLDNLRTLCTPCHLKVTRRQAGQRATMKKLSGAAGQIDITAFFQRT